MLNVTIDGVRVEAHEGETILSAARRAGADIPTLCWMKDINEIGSCRVCVVEVEGQDGLAAACNAPSSTACRSGPRARRSSKPADSA